LPELPDVEGYRRVAREAAGRRVQRIDVLDRSLLRGGRPAAVEGTRFGDPVRHGKWLFLPAGEVEVLMRKFGGVWISKRGRERVTGSLGPDAADVDRERLRELLGGRRGGIKAALMDQRLIAGLGNLMVDEIDWRARIHPRADVRGLSRRRLDRLWEAMDGVVRESLPAGRVPAIEGWLTGVRDARDARCPRCGARLRRATVAGRTTVWCPRCQRR
jgi:formamidopyrimidine-DNA glycosylase